MAGIVAGISAATAAGLSNDKPIIPLITKWDEDEVTLVTLKNTVNVAGVDIDREVEIPKMTEDDVEHIIRCINEFDDVCGAENLNIATSGARLYSYFRKTLSQEHKDQWDIDRTGHPASAAGFRAAIGAFIAGKIEPTDLGNIRRYWEVAKKPKSMNHHQLGSRLRFLNSRILIRFPGAAGAAPYNDNGLKRIFFQMSDPLYKTNFVAQGRNLDTMGFNDVINFMKTQEKAYPGGFAALEESNNNRKSRSNNNDSRNNKRGSNKKAGRSSSLYQSPAKAKTKSSDACPFEGHENHSWANCFGNPNSPNYKANFKLPAVRKNVSNSSNNYKKRDAHILDDANLATSDSDTETRQQRRKKAKVSRKNNKKKTAKKKNSKKKTSPKDDEEGHWLDIVGYDSE